MNTGTVARRLIELCSRNEFLQAQHELYAAGILSIETDGSQTRGKEQMHVKEQHFLSRLEKIIIVHYTAPAIAGSYFSTVLTMEIELKQAGYRRFEEVCVYQVANGQIIFEQFFRDEVH